VVDLDLLGCQPEAVQPEAGWLFTTSGDGYEISAFGVRGHFKGSVGLDYLFQLIQAPGRPVPIVELLSKKGARPADNTPSKQPVLDEDYKRQLKESLEDLEAKLDKAKKNNGHGEIKRITPEIEHLMSTMRSAVGIGGRDRGLNDTLDKRRSAISMAIRRACDVLQHAEPPMNLLADHFRVSIKAEMPTFVYKPTPAPRWSCEKRVP
jgi:hypothetical protein